MLDLRSTILRITKAKSLQKIEEIQSLWSGYGNISRYSLQDGITDFVVVKEIKPPTINKHPRGWNSTLSHKRKLTSYEVEKNWYRNYANIKEDHPRTPTCLGIETLKNQSIIVLQDLNHCGYPDRKQSLSWKEAQDCISWLANFHALHLGKEPTGLWEVGTYWHLETRPEELDVLADEKLKEVAPLIDSELNRVNYKTLVHGDAKVANFCFGEKGVAGVDFQYVGGGCGMKDLAYFVGSFLNENESERLETQILDFYFSEFRKMKNIPELEKEWRDLYYVAWADFHRFLKGWSPGHWKINSYSEKILQEVMNRYSF